MNAFLSHLPDCIYRIILSDLQDNDQICFCQTSTFLFHSFQREVRKLQITANKNQAKRCFRFLAVKKYRKWFLEMIKDPYQQLRLNITIAISQLCSKKGIMNRYSESESESENDFDVDTEDSEVFYPYFEEVNTCKESKENGGYIMLPNGFCILPLESLNSLSINYDDFICYFANDIKRIEHLVLLSGRNLDIQNALDIIESRNKLGMLEIKELELSLHGNGEIVLPTIIGLQCLSLVNSSHNLMSDNFTSCCSTLHELTLASCYSVVNVAILNTIPKLHLRSCGKIEDISCLNDNQSIEIVDCCGIEDYTQCCRNSKNIILSIANLQARVHLSSFQQARKLDITANWRYRDILISFSDSVLPNLKSLQLKGSNILIIDRLPFMFLTELVLGTCKSVTSVETFSSVPNLKLVELVNLTSLHGLGSANKRVVILSCDNISSFAPLRNCSEVTIGNCEGFTTSACEELDHVKRLRLENINKHLSLNNLQNLEILEVSGCPKIKSFIGLAKLKVLQLEHGMIEDYNKPFVLRHLKRCGYEKIVLLSINLEELEDFPYRKKIQQTYHVIEHHHDDPEEKHVVLLLKKQDGAKTRLESESLFTDHK